MSHMEMEGLVQGFLDEAHELINSLEEALLKLESDYQDEESIASVFRVMHTLKGSGAMFGFTSVSSFTHLLENIFDRIRGGNIKLTDQILNLTFESVDLIKNLLKSTESPSGDIKIENDRLLKEFEKICELNDKSVIIHDEEDLIEDTTEKTPTYYLYFEPNEDIMKNGTNPLYLIDELMALGSGEVFANTSRIPSFDEFNAQLCLVNWEIILSTNVDLNEILDVFIFVEDDSKIEVEKISELDLLKHSIFVEKLSDYIGTNESAAVYELQQFALQIEKEIKPSIPGKPKKDDQRKSVQIIDSKEINSIPDTEEPVKLTKVNEVPAISKNSSSIRVSSQKVETLINLVSEMVTTQARLSLLAQNAKNTEIIEVAETLEKLTRQLRDNAFEISLIPISSLITRFQRLIRDLSKELDKDVEFITEGTDTELDKTIIESLSDPLMHLFRNAIDHGLESKEERLASGKNEKGLLIFKAYYSGTSVYIDITDDGKGINTEKVREIGIKKGIIKKEQQLTEKQIHELILMPGFSTSESVTDISGRGVGMDVVKKNINKIQGEIEIFSKQGKGTTFSLKLPLTLSIIDGLLVQIDNDKFIIPILVIKKIAPVLHQNVKKAFNNTISIEGEQIPFLYLRNEFQMESQAPKMEEVVVVNYGDKSVGIVIDRVIRESQVVVKSLGRHFKEQEIISGASILGDGIVALVLDTNKIIEKYSR
jgi:two-component system chemotaxis sensor kinase CheA